ncbi:asparagine synthase (glutamine-hydrolyzing) [Marimonas arenosa]|uniref:asparagine synthase (glutamine-hydrolyzing) n=1 Tax=Marimonas arenosa TaxID=1795305 RepID=A0AAE3WD89_9RHOB|nr:asparagine synthase (glutamine-hydrolyzing) [Marimonas arenosa]MDQ2089642.1 asparagine synthase (glutamine-hydrolyzing) [Marimonas arenosa]
MCGICGIFVSHPGAQLPDHAITDMLGMIQHRGPDASGVYRDDQITLGHARLSVIDLETGDQPISCSRARYWISYNGEVYNYLELRDELIALGHTFHTKSDTEVVVNAFSEWGPRCFQKFNGQWAAAIWDSWENRLVLSRDPIGICPLFYVQNNGNLLFASEVKAIFANANVSRALSKTGLCQVFTLWGSYAPQTVYSEVHEVPPGHCVLISSDTIRKEAYWRLEFGVSEPGDRRLEFGPAMEELEAQLTRATQLRFTRADVPVGAYLSGGIDSAITASLVKQLSCAPVDTYSLRFSDPEFDEGEYQSLVSSDLGTTHHEIAVSAEDIAKTFPEAVFHAERPILRTAPVPMYLLSREVRNNDKKVVVTGEGADEMLGGYDLFREAKVRRFIARNPTSKVRKHLVEKLYPWMERNPANIPAFGQSFFSKNIDLADPGFSHRPRWDTSRAITQFLHDPDTSPEKCVLDDLPHNFETWHPLEMAQWIEIKTLLNGYLLSAQGDRMLMGNGVEGRFPFLDINVIEFACKMNPAYKLWGLREKHILKRAFSGRIPTRVISRPKQPYRAPEANVFFSPSAQDWIDYLSRDVLDTIELIDSRKVKKLFEKGEKFSSKKMSNTDNMRIVAMLSLALIQEQFVLGRGLRPKPVKVTRHIDRRSERRETKGDEYV